MLTFDFRDFERAARRMNALANQIPFALARSLNDAAEVAIKQDLPQAWAEHITVRNPNFLKAALSTKGTRATKQKLRVEVYDRLGRGSLKLHDTGGTKKPRGQAIAIPNKTNLQPRRTGRGVPKGLRPRSVPNSFVKPSKYGPVLFQRTGAGKTRGLRAMYGLASSAPIRADVPVSSTFEATMRREVPRAFKTRIAQAMATARRVT